MSESDNFINLFYVFLGAVLLAVLAIFVFVIRNFIKLYLKRRLIKRQNDLSPVLTKQTKITSKRTLVTGGSGNSNAITIYFAAFEFSENQERAEFRISSSDYGLMAENDSGKLTFQGTRFHKFQRTLQ